MPLPIISIGRLYRDVMARVISRSVLFSVKAIYLGVPILRRLVVVFIIFETLVDSSAAYSLSNSPRLILLEEFVGINNHVGVYRGGKFHH